jgi:hypothetical protein
LLFFPELLAKAREKKNRLSHFKDTDSENKYKKRKLFHRSHPTAKTLDSIDFNEQTLLGKARTRKNRNFVDFIFLLLFLEKVSHDNSQTIMQSPVVRKSTVVGQAVKKSVASEKDAAGQSAMVVEDDVVGRSMADPTGAGGENQTEIDRILISEGTDGSNNDENSYMSAMNPKDMEDIGPTLVVVSKEEFVLGTQVHMHLPHAIVQHNLET